MISKQLLNKTFSVRNYARHANPIKRTLDVISMDIPFINSKGKKRFTYPEHADIVVVGGGHIGSAVAYSLKSRAGEGLSVVVLEKDFSYENAQRNISFGTLTQHFSLPENIALSKYATEFFRSTKANLGKDWDLQYIPTGSLVLASEQYANKLEENAEMLTELGVRNEILTAVEISKQFPWIYTKDVKLGCMAIEAEGTFNSWTLLQGLIHKSKELGATYVNAEVVGFELERQKDVLMEGVSPGTFQRINKVVYKTEDNEEYAIKFAICVLAAGYESGNIATLAGIGKGENILQIPLPIQKREYNIYSIEEKAKETGLCTPLVTDTTGLWLMRNGLQNNLICGSLPMMQDDTKDMSDEEYFNNIIKPSLLNRFPSCTNAEIKKLMRECHDCNTYDNSGILGPHPYHNNLYLATGFGKLGCQHAPGIGRAISELIIDSQYTTIDLTRFSFDRFLTNDAIVDFNVY